MYGDTEVLFRASLTIRGRWELTFIKHQLCARHKSRLFCMHLILREVCEIDIVSLFCKSGNWAQRRYVTHRILYSCLVEWLHSLHKATWFQNFSKATFFSLPSDLNFHCKEKSSGEVIHTHTHTHTHTKTLAPHLEILILNGGGPVFSFKSPWMILMRIQAQNKLY